jgi:hypothetical protein
VRQTEKWDRSLSSGDLPSVHMLLCRVYAIVPLVKHISSSAHTSGRVNPRKIGDGFPVKFIDQHFVKRRLGRRCREFGPEPLDTFQAGINILVRIHITS